MDAHVFAKESDKNWPNDTYFYTDATTDTGQAITIQPYHKTVTITLSDGTNTATAVATLPPVSKWKGQTITIYGKDVAGGITLTASPTSALNDSPDWTNLTIGTDGDIVALKSDGEKIIIVENSIT